MNQNATWWTHFYSFENSEILQNLEINYELRHCNITGHWISDHITWIILYDQIQHPFKITEQVPNLDLWDSQTVSYGPSVTNYMKSDLLYKISL